MDRTSFIALCRDHLYPILRGEGFRGSGATLRRIAAPVVHVFHFQGSRHSDGCFLNLGAHLTFLPPEGGLDVAPERFDDAHCAFRTRITRRSSADAWPYGENESDALAIVREMAGAWATQAVPFFEAYGSFPEGYRATIAAHRPGGDRLTLHYARIAAYLGLNEQALSLAKVGVARTSERATLLRASFADVVDSVESKTGAA